LTAPISNWVILEAGLEKTLRFSDYQVVKRQVTDPVTRVTKEVESLQFFASEEGGGPSFDSFSIISQRLAGESPRKAGSVCEFQSSVSKSRLGFEYGDPSPMVLGLGSSR
jgi:hypothetical protein